MRICLIITGRKGVYFNQPLGLCSIAAELKKRGFANITGIDLSIASEKEITRKLMNSDLIGISITTKFLPEAASLIRRIKAVNPRAIVVTGGAHPTLFPEEMVEKYGADYTVAGEGEFALPELVKAVAENDINNLKDIGGLYYRDGSGQIVTGSPPIFYKDLDSYPFPDRDLFPVDQYPGVDHYPMAASRSCPYRCTNCQPALKYHSGPFRLRSPENVVAEMLLLNERYGGRMFSFIDSDLTIKKSWINAFCELLIKAKRDLFWGGNIRANTVDNDTLKLMKQAGFIRASMGIESGSQDVVNNALRKNIPLRKVRSIIEWCDQLGIFTEGYFMIGIPGETREQMLETVEFAKTLNLNTMSFNVGNPYPKTGFEIISRERGWLLLDSWDHLELMDEIFGGHKCLIRTDQWGPEFVNRVKSKIVKDFTEMGWFVDGNLGFMPAINYPKFASQLTWYRFFRRIAKHLLLFIKTRQQNQLRYLISLIKHRFSNRNAVKTKFYDEKARSFKKKKVNSLLS